MARGSQTNFPSVAVITPVFNEAETLRRYFSEAALLAASCPDFTFTFHLVDDGSSDDSWNIIREQSAMDESFRGLRLNANHGSHQAIAAGIKQADADIYVVLCCDLQDPPEKIPEMLRKRMDGYDIVWGCRNLDEEGFFKNISIKAFYFLMNRIACPRGTTYSTGSFYLFSRKVADKIKNAPGRVSMMEPLIASTRFSQTAVYYNRAPRASGTSGWTISKKFKAALDVLVGSAGFPAISPVVIGSSLVILSVSAHALSSRFAGFANMQVFKVVAISGIFMMLSGVTALILKKIQNSTVPSNYSILEIAGVNPGRASE